LREAARTRRSKAKTGGASASPATIERGGAVAPLKSKDRRRERITRDD